jgi:hypothetical protein
MAKRKRETPSAKSTDLSAFRENGVRQYLTTNQGLRINDDQNSLTDPTAK